MSTTKASDASTAEDTHVFRGLTVLIKVGPEAKEYHLHEALIVRHSRFFHGALSNPMFSSAQDKAVNLSDIEPGTFDIFAYWLYHGKLPDRDLWCELFLGLPNDSKKESTLDELDRMCSTKVVHAYVLADRLLALGFKHHCLEKAVEMFSDEAPSYVAITFAWENLPEKSALLEALVRAHCHHIGIRAARRNSFMQESPAAVFELPSNLLFRVAELYEVAIGDPSEDLNMPADIGVYQLFERSNVEPIR